MRPALVGSCPGYGSALPYAWSHARHRFVPVIYGQRIIRNAAAMFASQPLTWAMTLIFTVVVPRNVGPGQWGEWAVAMASGGLAKAVLDLGINTVLFKGVSRHPEVAKRAIGVVLTIRLGLTPVFVLGIVGFSFLAGYSQHTRLIVALIALSLAANYAATPFVFGLQAFERMHLTAAANVLITLILTCGAIVLVKFFALGVVSISLLALAAQAVGLVLQWLWLNRIVPVVPTLDWKMSVQLIKEGLPYWATLGFLSVYIWLDAVVLSLFGSIRENGWYGAAGSLISTLGFLPYVVTTAVFPALSRTIRLDTAEAAELAGRSFRLVSILSLPMSVGLALVAGNLVTAIYGGWFAPAGQVLSVLALTLPPVFVATLVNTFLIAADRQIQWTGVMGAMCLVNLLLNLVTIPFFHSRYGNGALGAAVALLVTDLAMGAAALMLMPARLRPAIRASVPSILAAALATGLMAVAVWPLARLFLPVPVLVGAAVFSLTALPLGAFHTDELKLVKSLPRRLARFPLELRRYGGLIEGAKAGPESVATDSDLV